MIENSYQMVYELNCNELYVLKNKEHLRDGKIRKNIQKKCGF